MKNIFYMGICILLAFSCVPKYEPSLDFLTINAGIKVTQNKKFLKLGDTLNFRLELSDIFATKTGTQKVENADMLCFLDLGKMGNRGLEDATINDGMPILALPTDILWKAKVGALETNTGNRLSRFIPSYTSNKYVIDFDLIPTIKDTFFVTLQESNMSTKVDRKFYPIYFNFLSNNRHLEAIENRMKIPQNEYGDYQRSQTYAFIVE
jgi:hypothetical protein